MVAEVAFHQVLPPFQQERKGSMVVSSGKKSELFETIKQHMYTKKGAYRNIDESVVVYEGQ